MQLANRSCASWLTDPKTLTTCNLHTKWEMMPWCFEDKLLHWNKTNHKWNLLRHRGCFLLGLHLALFFFFRWTTLQIVRSGFNHRTQHWWLHRPQKSLTIIYIDIYIHTYIILYILIQDQLQTTFSKKCGNFIGEHRPQEIIVGGLWSPKFSSWVGCDPQTFRRGWAQIQEISSLFSTPTTKKIEPQSSACDYVQTMRPTTTIRTASWYGFRRSPGARPQRLYTKFIYPQRFFIFLKSPFCRGYIKFV